MSIKASKTDVFRKGTTVCLKRTSSEICQVAVTLTYMAMRGGCSTRTVLQRQIWSVFDEVMMMEEVRMALDRTGVKSGEYAGHSLRMGQQQQQQHRDFQHG